MSPKTKIKDKAESHGQLSADDTKIIVGALGTAIESYDSNEKTFRQAAEDIRNGKDVPMFVKGEPGAKMAINLAEEAYKRAEAARDVLERLTEEEG